MRARSLSGEDPLEEELATHSSIPAWRIPRIEEPGGLRSWGRKELGMTHPLSAHVPQAYWIGFSGQGQSTTIYVVRLLRAV